jgi:hypothetical protein
MAEIGVIASVIGVASLGAKVSMMLFECGRDMRHWREQTDEIASEVNTFTNVLRELGMVLKVQEGFYTDDAVRIVEATLKDCKAVFKQIRSKIKFKQRSTAGLRWLFKKSRAKELKSRMEALKSSMSLILQVVQLGRKVDDVKSR